MNAKSEKSIFLKAREVTSALMALKTMPVDILSWGFRLYHFDGLICRGSLLNLDIHNRNPAYAAMATATAGAECMDCKRPTVCVYTNGV